MKEGDKVTLDGSASTDPDNDPLSFSWEQISPRQPTVKLETSGVANKVGFLAPDVNRDSILRFKLVVKDSNGGQALDSINILVKNAAVAESPSTNGPQTLPKEQGAQLNQGPTSQETAPSSAPSSDSGSGSTASHDTTSIENHSPTAETLQIVSIDQNKPLSISLKGNDPDKDDKISYLIVTNPSLGTIAGFDKTSGYLTYMPTSGFKGQDRLNFKVVDSHGAESNNGLIVIRANATSSSPSSLPSVPSSESSSPPRLPSSPSLSPPIANENTTTPTTATNENNTVATGASLTHRCKQTLLLLQQTLLLLQETLLLPQQQITKRQLRLHQI